MTKPTPPPLKEAFDRRIEMRVGRLQKLVALKAPPSIIAREAVMVMDALLGGYPQDMGTAYAEFYGRLARVRAGYCVVPDCLNPQAEDRELCASCDAEEAAEVGPIESLPPLTLVKPPTN